MYGCPGHYVDVTEKFKNMYGKNGQYILGLQKKFNDLFSDPCPSTLKKLVILNQRKVFWIDEHDRNRIEIFELESERNVVRLSPIENNDIADVKIYYEEKKDILYIQNQRRDNDLIYWSNQDRVFGFHHICTMGNWEVVVNDQIQTMLKSGLYDKSGKDLGDNIGITTGQIEIARKI